MVWAVMVLERAVEVALQDDCEEQFQPLPSPLEPWTWQEETLSALQETCVVAPVLMMEGTAMMSPWGAWGVRRTHWPLPFSW